MTILQAPKAILFDWDNTLVDTWPVIHVALEKTFVEMGREPWSLEKVKERVARSMRDSFPAIFGEQWEEAGAKYQQNFRSIHLERLTPLAGSQAMLEVLKTLPVYVGVASNKKGVTLRQETQHIGWDSYFSKVIGAEDTPNDKPAPDMVYAALAGSGIKAGNEVWFIGDSNVDMECAYHAGCIPVFYGELPATSLTHPFARHVKNHQELTALFHEVF